MTLDPRLQDALTRVDKDKLLLDLLTGRINEEIGKAAGLQTKADDPPTPAPTPEPTKPETLNPDQTAELTDAEADNVSAKIWSRLEQRIDAKFQEQQTAVAKASEPVTAELATVKADVAEVKTILKSLAGVQPAGEAYRASQAVDTIVGLKAGDGAEDTLSPAERLAARQRQRHGGA